MFSWFRRKMKTSTRGRDFIKDFEDLSLEPYICPSGKPTIGWGCTEYENGKAVTMEDDPITLARAESLFSYTIKKFELGVQHMVPLPLNQNQFDALVSFFFNTGVEALINTNTLKHLRANEIYQFLTWHKKWCKGTVNGELQELPGLVRRRLEEQKLFVEIPLKD